MPLQGTPRVSITGRAVFYRRTPGGHRGDVGAARVHVQRVGVHPDIIPRCDARILRERGEIGDVVPHEIYGDLERRPLSQIGEIGEC